MNELNDIFETLRGLGLCRNQAEFSSDWLGRSPGYLAYLKSTGARPDMASIGLVIARLKDICPTCNDSRYWNERHQIRSAICAAKTMWLGEFELAHVPPWSRVTAVD